MQPISPTADFKVSGKALHAGQTLTTEMMPVARLRPAPRNARRHPKRQIRQIAASIERFGFNNPVLISDENQIIAGHGRVEAARLLGIECVPAVRLSHLDEAQRRAYLIADNKLALKAGWDREVLATELSALIDLGFDVEITGFSVAEIDILLDKTPNAPPTSEGDGLDELAPAVDTVTATSEIGDLWLLDRHRLICGDPCTRETFDLLLAGERGDLIFTKLSHHGLIGANQMSRRALRSFLQRTLGHAASACRNGAIAFVGTDWQNLGENLAAGVAGFSELKDLCVWNKFEAAAGALYRGQHELVLVFAVCNIAESDGCVLGGLGRNRTNVWTYAAVNPSAGGGAEKQTPLPTPYPVALVADAIEDYSRAGEIVLDPFAGSGTTMVAAEKTGRRAYLIEFDPADCDRIVRRFETATGKQARLAATGQSFGAVAEERAKFSTKRKERGDVPHDLQR